MSEDKARPKAAARSRASKPGQSDSAKNATPKPTAKAKPMAVEAALNSKGQATGDSASKLIDQRIRELGDWRGETLACMRSLILEAAPEMIEEWKWMGTPVWSHDGIVCTGESYQSVVKLTFAKGASLPDPSRLFNSSLEGNTRRAIDIREGEKVDAKAFKTLIKAAVDLNGAKAKKPKASPKQAKPTKLLSGGNPQIAKADGDAPIQAYIAAMPGWKREVGERIDALIEKTVPRVRKAVKWNSPFYGVEDQGWFLSLHVFTRYVKVTFFKGLELKPIPPGGTERSKDARWIDIYEGNDLDEAQLAKWIKQAAAIPGWMS